jgi:D-lactate dehydrogenase (cytochrome)
MPHDAAFAELASFLGDRLARSKSERAAHGTSETWFPEILPDAVAYPESTAEVARILGICAAHRVPVTAWGTGTALEGHALALEGGLSLDLGRMNRVLAIRADDLQAVVQPGVTREALNADLRATGLMFPIDPGANAALGGMAATRASGTTAVRYGTMRDNVMALEVVLADGRVIRTGSGARKSSAGYDLTGLFVGSEGTLGIMTEITLRLIPKPQTKRTLLAVFPSLDDASETVTRILLSGVLPASIELMDNTTIRAVEDFLHIGLPTHAEAVLLIEVDGEATTVIAHAETIAQLCRDHGAEAVKLATTPEESDGLWLSRRSAGPALLRLRPNRLNEDIVVPRGKLPALVRRIREIGQHRNLLIGIFGHAGDGNLHPTILYDARDADEVARMHLAEGEIYAATVELGGTLTGEHGVGLSKKQYLSLDLPQPTRDLMRQMKTMLDPNGILNPGKIFPD